MSPFTRDLLAWYDIAARVLPWRGEAVPPYHTWLSEIMLQQTRVQTVLPYFHRFLERFPRVQDLAVAPLDEVLAMWSGLGYYSRARNLHRAAQMVVEQGAFPDTIKGLRALPGVGEYVSAAVGSISFGLPVPAVDGNLERVLSRVHAHPGGRTKIRDIAQVLVPANRPGDFNQALMDLGSRICKPKSPSCPDCPVQVHCAGLKTGTPTAFPEPKKRRVVPTRAGFAAALWRDGRLLLARRPNQGLFGGLYELPGALVDGAADPVAEVTAMLADQVGLDVAVRSRLGTVKHTLTHMHLMVTVVGVEDVGGPNPPVLSRYTAFRWVDPADIVTLESLGLSTLARKTLEVAYKARDTQGQTRT